MWTLFKRVTSDLWYVLSKNWKLVLSEKHCRIEVWCLIKHIIRGYKCVVCSKGRNLAKVSDEVLYVCNCKKDFKMR
jgi:hypothetical protein